MVGVGKWFAVDCTATEVMMAPLAIFGSGDGCRAGRARGGTYGQQGNNSQCDHRAAAHSLPR
jgi:hypothetical protein